MGNTSSKSGPVNQGGGGPYKEVKHGGAQSDNINNNNTFTANTSPVVGAQRPAPHVPVVEPTYTQQQPTYTQQQPTSLYYNCWVSNGRYAAKIKELENTIKEEETIMNTSKELAQSLINDYNDNYSFFNIAQEAYELSVKEKEYNDINRENFRFTALTSLT